ncbi:MAG TPA: dihydrolipoamide succinyltransferase, partial [Polyangia bacterium]|nr:dihydrolipoamide succinyltransferase [Polyangia bacterium]
MEKPVATAGAAERGRSAATERVAIPAASVASVGAVALAVSAATAPLVAATAESAALVRRARPGPALRDRPAVPEA